MRPTQFVRRHSAWRPNVMMSPYSQSAGNPSPEARPGRGAGASRNGTATRVRVRRLGQPGCLPAFVHLRVTGKQHQSDTRRNSRDATTGAYRRSACRDGLASGRKFAAWPCRRVRPFDAREWLRAPRRPVQNVRPEGRRGARQANPPHVQRA